MYTHTRAYINVYAYIYTDIHIYIYIHIHMHLNTHTCTHIYIRIHMHTCAQIENPSNNASTCQAWQYHKRTYASICICMHIRTYIHIHICAQPAASVFADVYVGVQTHLCNINTCPCTSAQKKMFQSACNTHCKKMHIYIYLHTYVNAYICTQTHMRMHDTVHTLKHRYWDPQSIHKYAYTYTYTCV